MSDYQCCPFARSGGLHGEDCTYAGKSHCPFRMAAEGLDIVTAKQKAVLDAMAGMTIYRCDDGRPYVNSCPEALLVAELARRELK